MMEPRGYVVLGSGLSDFASPFAIENTHHSVFVARTIMLWAVLPAAGDAGGMLFNGNEVYGWATNADNFTAAEALDVYVPMENGDTFTLFVAAGAGTVTGLISGYYVGQIS